MIGDKFSYLDHNGIIQQSIVYLDTTMNEFNTCEAEINNIRREINNLRKDKGLTLFKKIMINFEINDYWHQINIELKNILINRLGADIQFVEQLENYNIIKTFNGKEFKVLINII